MKFLRYFLIPLIAALTSCGKPPPVVQAQYLESPPADFPLVAGEAGVNDISLFLAGKPVRRGALLSRFQQTVEYQTHHREMAALWRQAGRVRVSRMREWSYEELTPVVSGLQAVHYPFGGPDLLYVHGMFPQIPHYALMGLEPVGEVPPLEAMPLEEVLGALAAFRQATRTQLQAGYFITKDMRSDLERSALRGVTPILLCTIGLMGGEVDAVEPFTPGGNAGVRLHFRSARGTSHSAMYVSGDLSNRGFGVGYANWLSALGSSATYFKAASYLMHDDRFSQARNYFLSQSRVILQDDSGIPYRYLTGPEWSVDLYGNYERPIELFTKHHQNDLAQAYASRPTTPLNFGSGYHVNPWEANLLLAVRR